MKIRKNNKSTRGSVNEYIVLKQNYMSTRLEPKEISTPEEAALIGSIMAKNAAKKLKLNLNIK